LKQKKNHLNWYIVYYVRDAEGRRQRIERNSGTTDKNTAMGLASEVHEVQQGHERQDKLRTIFDKAGANTETIGTRYSIGDLWKYYTQQPTIRSITDRTLNSKKTHITRFIDWLRSNQPEMKYLDDITERTAASFMESIGKKSGVTRNNYLSSLHSIFATVRIPLGLKMNVWEAVPRAEIRSIRKQEFSIEQIREIFKHSKKYKSRYPGFWQIAISLAYHTGMRLGDVCTLSWDELDFDNSMIRYVPNKGRKKGRDISYPFDSSWSAPLRKLWDGQKAGPVWIQVDWEYNSRQRFITEEFEDICKLAGIKTTRKKQPGEIREKVVKLIGFHSLRHSHVTMALDGGAALSDVQKTVGHGSPVMTEHYNHSLAAGKRVAEKLPGLKK